MLVILKDLGFSEINHELKINCSDLLKYFMFWGPQSVRYTD